MIGNIGESKKLCCSVGYSPGRKERGRGNGNTSSVPSVMRASRGVRRSNCKQIWLRVHDLSEGMLKLLLYKILLV
jgi:hypothetical protein